MPAGRPEVRIERIEVAAYRIPTDAPEADGTLAWDSTVLVVVEAHGGGRQGVGYTYADPSAAALVAGKLAPVISGRDALAAPAAWEAMVRAIRNLGRPGIASMAISAVDAALWDLQARLLDAPLVHLLGASREAVPVYGSGGFTSYDTGRLQEQLGRWAGDGIGAVKMKVGSEPARDPARVQAAREAIGKDVALFVDANGAYRRKEALHFAERFAAFDVTWFEEPVSSDDLEGLRLLRDRSPAGMQITAGEYGYDAFYFRRMLEAGAVDVLQADATRCGGITGFLRAGALCAAHGLPFSAHTAPALHLHPCLAVGGELAHLEYFHDHVRIEELLFDGAPRLERGKLKADPTRPGLGLEFKRADAERFRL